jgi:hypothetical protein
LGKTRRRKGCKRQGGKGREEAAAMGHGCDCRAGTRHVNDAPRPPAMMYLAPLKRGISAMSP